MLQRQRIMAWTVISANQETLKLVTWPYTEAWEEARAFWPETSRRKATLSLKLIGAKLNEIQRWVKIWSWNLTWARSEGVKPRKKFLEVVLPLWKKLGKNHFTLLATASTNSLREAVRWKRTHSSSTVMRKIWVIWRTVGPVILENISSGIWFARLIALQSWGTWNQENLLSVTSSHKFELLNKKSLFSGVGVYRYQGGQG